METSTSIRNQVESSTTACPAVCLFSPLQGPRTRNTKRSSEETLVPVQIHECEQLIKHSPLKPTVEDRLKLRGADTVWLLQFAAYELQETLHFHDKV